MLHDHDEVVLTGRRLMLLFAIKHKHGKRVEEGTAAGIHKRRRFIDPPQQHPASAERGLGAALAQPCVARSACGFCLQPVVNDDDDDYNHRLLQVNV